MFTVDEQLPTPSTPILATVAPDCDMDGSTTITDYASNLTYTFAPTGPSALAGGIISGAALDIAYTVTATNAEGCTSMSASFTLSLIHI